MGYVYEQYVCHVDGCKVFFGAYVDTVLVVGKHVSVSVDAEVIEYEFEMVFRFAHLFSLFRVVATLFWAWAVSSAAFPSVFGCSCVGFGAWHGLNLHNAVSFAL